MTGPSEPAAAELATQTRNHQLRTLRGTPCRRHWWQKLPDFAHIGPMLVELGPCFSSFLSVSGRCASPSSRPSLPRHLWNCGDMLYASDGQEPGGSIERAKIGHTLGAQSRQFSQFCLSLVKAGPNLDSVGQIWARYCPMLTPIWQSSRKHVRHFRHVGQCSPRSGNISLQSTTWAYVCQRLVNVRPNRSKFAKCGQHRPKNGPIL